MARTKPQQLRDILNAASIAVTPGCYDAVSARIVQQAGFPAAYLSGLCVAASLGYPDIGIIGAAEMVERTRVIARNIDLPLLADADTGYGEASNIAETVRAFEQAGAAGIHLEDQTMPKKCAALAGKTLVSIAAMTARIRIAVQARRNPDFVIVGRTDAFLVDGLQESIARAKAYETAGADATMVMSLSQESDMQAVTSSLKKPCIVLMAEKMRPLIAPQRLRELGYPMVIYPLSLLMQTVRAQKALAERLRREGTTESMLDGMAPLPEINDLLGLPDTVRLEAQFQAMAAPAR